MSTNMNFRADVMKLADVIGAHTAEVAGAVAVAIHRKLAQVTPLRSGRARASWNIVQSENPDLSVPPFHPGNGFDATPSEISEALSFYQPYLDRNLNFVPYTSTITVDGNKLDAAVFTVSNNLFYIEQLNNGTSKQADASFFQTAVQEMEFAIQSQIGHFGSRR